MNSDSIYVLLKGQRGRRASPKHLVMSKKIKEKLCINEVFQSTVLKLLTSESARIVLTLCCKSSLQSQNPSRASGTVHASSAVPLELSPKDLFSYTHTAAVTAICHVLHFTMTSFSSDLF